MNKKIISFILAVSMMLGIIIASVPALNVSAAQAVVFDPKGFDYLTQPIGSKEAKLKTMNLMLTKGNYELYYEEYTGEVAVKNIVTGDILMTNPYDIGSVKASDNIKNQLMSQIILKYQNNEGNELQMFSYVEAAQRYQISVKYIKNGIRVEYIMGKQESRSLVPRQIEKSRFEEMILANITEETKFNKLKSYYVEKNPYDKSLTERSVAEMKKSYPITEEMAIWVFDETSTEREINVCESIIKEFCPAYTYEELEYDHTLTEYESEEKNPVQFRMALEYTLDEDGVSVRLPANGIRFDQSAYQLSYIRILPYIGAGSSEYTGYTMIPDGSGALVRYEDVLTSGTSRVLSGKLYGQDYAYHTISGANQKVMRMPIFGLVENRIYTVKNPAVPVDDPTVADDTTDETSEEPTDETTEEIPEEPTEETTEVPTEEPVDVPEDTTSEKEAPADETTDEAGDDSDETTADSKDPDEPDEPEEPETYKRRFGWVAVIEEGESLASITTDHGGNITHKYNSVYTEFNPRPKDTYNLASSISVAGNSSWTVVSERKYTGSFRIRYIMLTDHEYAESNGTETAGLYDTNYVGMALAYRNLLINNGSIEKLQKADQIPLYIETLGSMVATEKVLSVPVDVKKALTTVDDIKTITEELNEEGITNIIYKLTGFINGGMNHSISNKIKVMKVLGGNDGLKDLIKWGKEKGIEFFLDIDFTYAMKNTLSDGFSLKRDAVRTIDDRYTTRRSYNAAYQYFTSEGKVAVSPSVFSKIFNNAEKYLEKLGVTSVSLGAIGSDLNSDFDEDDPYNREDSKENVIKTLEKIKAANYSIMLDGGNAYTLKYADHVLEAPLDSSNYTYSSESVPMFGLVYHGFLNFAGEATNMAGDIRYETLKILENGADPYFILVYQNSEKLKEDYDLCTYFSIAYQIWKEDLIETYNKLNKVLYPVFDSPFASHEFVIGERVPSDSEKQADEEAAAKALEEAAKAEVEALAEAERKEKLKKHLDELKGKTVDTSEEEEETTESVVTTADSETTTAEGDETSSDEETSDIEIIVPVDDNGYEYTKYSSDNGMIVKVSFENGYAFILNYNVFDVTVEETGDTVIPMLGFIVLNPEGNVININGEEVNA